MVPQRRPHGERIPRSYPALMGRRAIATKLFIALGLGVLLFLAWALWGSGLYAEQEQDELARTFEREPNLGSPARLRPARPPRHFSPRPGEPVFRLKIPTIDVSEVVVEGVGVEELKKGPGHYPSCRDGFERPLCSTFDEVFPGERGRVVVSGHRTTYGAPFFDLDKLKKGDRIFTETKWGEFVYRVRGIELVDPGSRRIVRKSKRPELVLTTCHPKYSAAQRLIVFADLEPV